MFIYLKSLDAVNSLTHMVVLNRNFIIRNFINHKIEQIQGSSSGSNVLAIVPFSHYVRLINQQYTNSLFST